MVDWYAFNWTWRGSTTGRSSCARGRACESGIVFTAIAELGDTADDRRAPYELNETCSADIPDRGEFLTHDEYVSQRMDVLTPDLRGGILEIDEIAWIGLSPTSLRPDREFACSEMTDLLAPYRGRGVSLALRLLAIRFVRLSGYRWLATFHHPRNVVHDRNRPTPRLRRPVQRRRIA